MATDAATRQGATSSRLIADARLPVHAGPTLCLVTRIEFARPWHVLRVMPAFRQMRRKGSVVPGFLGAWMHVRRPRTILLFSLWTDDVAIAEFATAVPEHLRMVRWAFSRGARTWSGLFEFIGVSHMTKVWALDAELESVTSDG